MKGLYATGQMDLYESEVNRLLADGLITLEQYRSALDVSVLPPVEYGGARTPVTVRVPHAVRPTVAQPLPVEEVPVGERSQDLMDLAKAQFLTGDYEGYVRSLQNLAALDIIQPEDIPDYLAAIPEDEDDVDMFDLE